MAITRAVVGPDTAGPEPVVKGPSAAVSRRPSTRFKEMDDRIAARMARHELLATSRTPPTAFSFIVEQAVLERGTGGEEVTRELYDHLLGVADRHWNVEFQLMPLRQPVHAGLDGPMQLAETPDQQWFGYSEGQENGRLITDRKEISRLHQRYAKMRSQALTPRGLRGPVEANARSAMNTSDLAWFKSSYSGSQGDDCVEVAMTWHKSSYSSGSQGDCVEVASCPGTVHVRDSKVRQGDQLAVSPVAWTRFLTYTANA